MNSSKTITSSSIPSRGLTTLIIVTLLCLSQSVFAAGAVNNAFVTSVRVNDNGRVVVYFDKNISGTPPSCVSSSMSNALAIDASTDGGKAVLSVVLTAKATGTAMHAFGLGTCPFFGAEAWNYGVII